MADASPAITCLESDLFGVGLFWKWCSCYASKTHFGLSVANCVIKAYVACHLAYLVMLFDHSEAFWNKTFCLLIGKLFVENILKPFILISSNSRCHRRHWFYTIYSWLDCSEYSDPHLWVIQPASHKCSIGRWEGNSCSQATKSAVKSGAKRIL